MGRPNFLVFLTVESLLVAVLVGGLPKWDLGAEENIYDEWPDRMATARQADTVVAKDNSGNYKTIMEAVAASVKQRKDTTRFVIYVKAGIYKENVVVEKSMENLMFIGDGMDRTIVTGDITANLSAPFQVLGNGFIARDMGFENTFGRKHQAVALRCEADRSVFYKCSFKGYQDTLYVHSHNQFYKNCDVYGTVDFIFGDAAAVFQDCNIYVRRPLRRQANTITAHSREDSREQTGIVFHRSSVTATRELRRRQYWFNTYLGRPWRAYSRTVFMKCYLDSLIDPAGWFSWGDDIALSNLYYGEYMNTGPGANTSGRVKWPGYKVIKSRAEARTFTVKMFLNGDSWLPETGVPFSSGL